MLGVVCVAVAEAVDEAVEEVVEAVVAAEMKDRAILGGVPEVEVQEAVRAVVHLGLPLHGGALRATTVVHRGLAPLLVLHRLLHAVEVGSARHHHQAADLPALPRGTRIGYVLHPLPPLIGR